MTTLIKEDGTKVAGANTYVEVQDYYDYLDERGVEATERYLGDELTASALVRACDYITNFYRGTWKGTKTYSDQALPFPRQNVYDEDDYLIANNVIPVELKRAQIEAARRFLIRFADDSAYSLKDDPTADDFVKSKTEKVDVISTSVEYWGATYTLAIPEVENLLSGLVSDGTRLVRS